MVRGAELQIGEIRGSSEVRKKIKKKYIYVYRGVVGRGSRERKWVGVFILLNWFKKYKLVQKFIYLVRKKLPIENF